MNTELYQTVQNALEEIRPFLKSDGGDIELVSIEDDVVKVRLMGACIACSVNQMTLKSGVESTIKKHVPQIKKVIDVSGELSHSREVVQEMDPEDAQEQ
ncbi:NifU family protein [Vaginella massiliensis]|uniref:NifU family protein n=1 Tax=Vaginella massiliensis TaxID=1816680 RepID=UPI00083860EC|nr:NifU family protein [Vaginella massiliensis]